MRFNWRQLVMVVICGLMFTACGNSESQAEVTIIAQDTTIGVGEKRGLSIEVRGSTDIQFEWSTTAGTLSDTSSQSVIFTAPDTPEPVIVTIKVTSGDQIVTDSITFTVTDPDTPIPEEENTIVSEVESIPEEDTTEPEATPIPAEDTPEPKATPIPEPEPTSVPEPISCDHRALARNIFPQLSEDIDFSFANSENSADFKCSGIYDRVHTSEELAISVKLEFQVGDNSFAFFGMSIPEGYDVSDFNEICLWVYSETPNQVFEVQMKDTDGHILSSEIIHEKANEWQEYCPPFDTFSSDEFSSLDFENILDFSIGFNEGFGSATVWIDDFELR